VTPEEVMAIFSGSTKTKRAVADPETDDTLPSSGALSWGGITGESAVAGTTGADCKLVNGDRWQQISGNHTENIDIDLQSTVSGNQVHTVTGNETIQIAGNATRDIIGNLTTSIIGAEIRSNIGVQNYTYVAPTSRMHAGERGTEESGGFFESVHMQYEWHLFAGEINAVKMEQTLTELTYVLLKTEGVSFETKAVEIANGVHGLKIEAGEMSALIKAAKSEVDGTALVARLVKASAEVRAKVPIETLGPP
jgi:hypothetical protein